MQAKVVVVGGSGAAGKIHLENCKKLGAIVANFDITENPIADHNYDAKTTLHSQCVQDGFSLAILAVPENIAFQQADAMLDSGFIRILIEKPGALISEQLEALIKKAESKGVTMYINYQRSFDERLSKLYSKVAELIQDGFFLDYVSVYSCDKAWPPQPFPQYLNQGCHDYAILLGILQKSGMKIEDLQSRGVKWQGKNDTKFFKITGSFSNQNQEIGLYDVQMGRVSSTGTFTEIYVKLSRFDEQANMYEPFEQKICFPEVADINSRWQDNWSFAFYKSAEALIKGENGVPVSLGVNTLKFSEMAGKSYNENGSILKNTSIF